VDVYNVEAGFHHTGAINNKRLLENVFLFSLKEKSATLWTVSASSPILYGLIGHPVAHSLSPVMMNAAFHALAIDARYGLADAPPGQFVAAAEALRRNGWRGANVTLPHKRAAFRYVHAHGELTDEARILQTVNTLVFHADGTLTGDNTDAQGFCDALRETFRISLCGKRVLILGSGGAGSALALASAFRRVESLQIAARNTGARRRLMSALRHAAPGLPVEDLPLRQAVHVAPACDVIIQTTPVGMKSEDASLLPESAFRTGQWVVDLIYSPPRTPFLEAAARAGARTANGLGMLLHQGARSFHRWTSRKAPLDAMRQALLDALKKKALP
jgi:shikimate dehydrogenase